MRQDGSLNIRCSSREKAKLQAQAHKSGQTISELLRRQLFPSVDELLAMALPHNSRARIRFILSVADNLAELGEGGEDEDTASGWLVKVDNLVGWLRANPWNVAGQAKALELFDNMPQCLRDALRWKCEGLMMARRDGNQREGYANPQGVDTPRPPLQSRVSAGRV